MVSIVSVGFFTQFSLKTMVMFIVGMIIITIILMRRIAILTIGNNKYNL